MILARRRILTLAAPALITGREALAQVPTFPGGFPSSPNPDAFPDVHPYSARPWNTGHWLAKGLEFAIVMGDFLAPNIAYDLVRGTVFYRQNSGTPTQPIPGLPRGSLLRFIAASSGFTVPSVSNPAAKTNPYFDNMTGAISLAMVGCWPVGAASTGSQQTVVSAGDNGPNGYNVPFDWNSANTMGLYRAGTGGAAYYSAVDNGAGAGSEYTQSRITTLGVSHSGAFPGGASAVRFYRGGKWTGSSNVTHDMSTSASVAGKTFWIGKTANNSGTAYGYNNGYMSMLYGWSNVIGDAGFAAVDQDKWWALRVPDSPMMAWVKGMASAATARPRGLIFQ